MSRRFFIADVFTAHAFGGNQLGVFPDAADIPDSAMQQIARELNFSETTFVVPPRKPGHTHRVRIFTPSSEIPFAGHPNVGTGVVLAAIEDRRDFVFDEDVGTVRVAVSGAGFAELTIERGAETWPLDVQADALAAMLSLPADGVAADRKPWIASAGIPFCCIPLANQDSVASAKLDLSHWERLFPADRWSRDVYAIAGDFAPGGVLKARMWAPHAGIAEDPATGSAAAALVGSLAGSLPDAAGVFSWTVEQGAEIGRPSLIRASAEKQDGKVIAIRVGGDAVIVAEGAFR
jgi:trans-2,3-dihydro-3-hydroxyanthranilate isomerase